MIRSAQNRKIKDIRRLSRSKGDVAVLEGPHLVAEALAAGLALAEVLVTPAFLSTPEGARLTRRAPSVVEVSPEILESLADADSPQGVLALASLPRGGVESLPVRPGGVYVYAEALQDPGNLGALVRTCEAAGVSGVALGRGSAHPNHRRSLRASAGSLLRLPTAINVAPEDLARRLEGSAPRWLALSPRNGVSWREAGVAGTVVLLVGAEGPGLSPELLGRAEQRLTIPLAPPVESLNATVAAALMLFEIQRRRG
jgi:TrmH family RNA methyltransferase